jgi:hypothetical protein
MAEETVKPNYFVRALISVFSLLLAAMIGYRFVEVIPRGEINAGLVTLLCLLLVVVLAESFDNFSVGKLTSISREVVKKEKEVSKLEQEKSQLFSQLVSLSVSQAQNQTHTNVYGDYNAAVVSPATKPEIEEKRSDESATQSKEDSASDNAESKISQTAERVEDAPVIPPLIPQAAVRLRFDWSKAEDIAYNKFFGQYDVAALRIQRNIKLTEKEQAFDPVSSTPVLFDAYYESLGNETFVEFKSATASIMFRDRLYVMLSKVNHYRLTKRNESSLILVLIRVPGENERLGNFERVLRDFAPAKSSGLLKVHEMILTEQEAALCREEY